MQSKISAVILAAGYSSRYPVFKPLAKHKDKYYIQNIIDKLKNICFQINIVTGFRSNLLKRKINDLYPYSNKITFIENKNFKQGMFSSIKAAAAYLKTTITPDDLFMIHLVDQPHISKLTYHTLVKAIITGNSDACIPSYKMQAGHPIIVNSNVILETCNSVSDKTLRDVLKQVTTNYIKVPDRNILKDVDIDADEESLE